MIRRISSALQGSISLVAFTAPVHAASSSIETVVVTASKRPEELKNVPMSVTALTGDSLAKVHATSFEDFVTRVPGMSSFSAEPGHTDLILRGINAGGVGSPIGTYMDEAPHGSSSALANGSVNAPNLHPLHIQRVQ